PDSLGASCNFQPYSFYLAGKRTYWGLPNNPNYSMLALGGTICDSLPTEINEPPVFDKPSDNKPKLYINYEEDIETVFINACDLTGKRYSLHISDVSGRKMFTESGSLDKMLYKGFKL